MGRRSKGSDIGFGSDSFLDIVTNMVGILIILIVIAGLKASRMPVDLDSLRKNAAPQLVETEVERPDPAPQPVVSEPVVLQPEKPVEPRVIEPSPELKRYAKELELELSRLESGRQNSREVLIRTGDQERAIEEQRRKALALLEAEQAQFKEAREKFGRVQGTLDETKSLLADLKKSLEDAANDKPPVKQIRHQLNPVSMMIDGNEIHFRLAKNRVAHVPLEGLIERLRPQIEQKKRQLVKSRVFQGHAGPVDGFVMKFVVEAQPASVVEDLRKGTSGMVRIGLTEWQIIPETDLEAESADQALHAGSKFLRVMKAAEPGTTLTMWVYPDSFELYRKLTEYAHDEGFTVAARPLPMGFPISGSPRGSKSAGQ